MRLLTTITISFFSITSLPAQTLIPWLGANGQYGYATEDGQLVVPPVFEQLTSTMRAGVLSANGRQEGKKLVLLRNGMTFAVSGHDNYAAPVKNYVAHGLTLLDSMDHLVALRQGANMRLVNLLTKAVSESYLNDINPPFPDWFKDQLYFAYYGERGPCKLFHGLLPVWKAEGRMNFIDLDFKEIFPRDFVAGMVADEQFFIVAEGPERFAIADRSGKIRTPFSWKKLEPAWSQEGLFIANSPRYVTASSPGKAGLIDANGKIVIDTIYHSIKSIGALLLVQKEGKFGLMDYDGKVVVPVEQQSITAISGTAFFMVQYNGREANVIDSKGRKMLSENPVSVFPKTIAGFPYLVANYKDKTSLFDTAMHLIQAFDTTIIYEIVQQDPLVCISIKSPAELLLGLRNAAGELVAAEKYKQISPISSLPNLMKVMKDSLYGILNTQGQEILRANFTEIRFETFHNNTLIWGLERGSNLWTLFDQTGKKLPESGRTMPSIQHDLPFGFQQLMPGSNRLAVIFSNGACIPMPDSLSSWQPRSQLRTPAGNQLVLFRYDSKSGKQELMFLDENLKNIVPPGYALAEAKEFTEPAIETGLVTVFRIKADKPSLPVSPKTTKPSAPVPEKEAVIEADFEVEEAKPIHPLNRYDACGVLGANGKWVLPPKEGVQYYPMSPYLVVELPIDEKFRQGTIYKTPFRIHRVNQPKLPVIEVNSVRQQLFDYKQTTMQFGRYFAQSKQVLAAYFDEKGNQLTPIGIQNGPVYLRSRNLIALANPDTPNEYKNLIINDKGETLFDLGKLGFINPPHEKNTNWKLDYFVVEEMMSPEMVEKLEQMPWKEALEIITDLKTPQGILDSAGQVVTPLKYNRLQIIAPGRLFGAQDTSGVFLLYDWQGKLLHAFNDSKPEKKLLFQSLSENKVVVSDNATSVLISADNRIEKMFLASFYYVPPGMWDSFFQLKNREGNVFWVSAKDGREYREP